MGCASYKASSAPVPKAADMPAWRAEGPLGVGADPYVELDRQKEMFGGNAKKAGILPIQVIVQNKGDRQLLVRESDMSLVLANKVELSPSGATGAAARLESSNDIIAASACCGLIGFAVASSSADKRREARLEDFKRKEFKKVTLRRGEIGYGFVYYIPPEGTEPFSTAILKVRFVDVEEATSTVVSLPLSGLDLEVVTQKDEEKERLGEKPELAYIPNGVAGEKVSLRTEPKFLLEKDIKKMLKKHNFYDRDLNKHGSFANDFVENGDGTTTDNSTGLMWQKVGSSRAKMWKRARTYVKQLNKRQFAGYSDWRLPTIEEFASLVEREKVNGVHIDPLFYDKQKMCWSSDKADPFGGHTRNPPQIWIVNFAKGKITTAILLSEVVPSTHSTSEYNYVRAVRGVK
jgi:hypothetical protein